MYHSVNMAVLFAFINFLMCISVIICHYEAITIIIIIITTTITIIIILILVIAFMQGIYNLCNM